MNKLFLRPYVYSHTSYSTKLNVILSLLGAQIILLALDKSFGNLLPILCCATASVIATILNEKVLSKYLTDNPFLINSTTEHWNSYKVALTQGVLVGFLTPQSYPLVSAFVITFFTCLIFKHLFGTFARTLVNPVAFAVLAMYLCNKLSFGNLFVTSLSIKSGFPSVALVNSNAFTLCPLDEEVTAFLNTAIFSKLGTVVPSSVISLLWDTHSPIPAARYNLLNIVSLVALCSNDNGRLLITAIFLPTYAILVRFITPLFFLTAGPLNKDALVFGDIFLALNSSGVLFCTAFLLCTTGSFPIKKKLRILYSFVAAFVTYFIVGVGTSPIGMCVVIVIMNFVVIFLRHTEQKQNLAHSQMLLAKQEESSLSKLV